MILYRWVLGLESALKIKKTDSTIQVYSTVKYHGINGIPLERWNLSIFL
jgi:hypothetical protein